MSYRPRYFNRPRKNTEGEEVSGEKSHMDGDVDQVTEKLIFLCFKVSF